MVNFPFLYLLLSFIHSFFIAGPLFIFLPPLFSHLFNLIPFLHLLLSFIHSFCISGPQFICLPPLFPHILNLIINPWRIIQNLSFFPTEWCPTLIFAHSLLCNAITCLCFARQLFFPVLDGHFHFEIIFAITESYKQLFLFTSPLPSWLLFPIPNSFFTWLAISFQLHSANASKLPFHSFSIHNFCRFCPLWAYIFWLMHTDWNPLFHPLDKLFHFHLCKWVFPPPLLFCIILVSSCNQFVPWW